MTPQENIRWYWDDLSSEEKVAMLKELHDSMSFVEKSKFAKAI